MMYRLADFRRGTRDIDNFYTIPDALGIIDEHLSGNRKHPAILLFAIVSLKERKEDGSDPVRTLELIPRVVAVSDRVVDQFRRRSADEKLAEEIEQRLKQLQEVEQSLRRHVERVLVSYRFRNGPDLTR